MRMKSDALDRYALAGAFQPSQSRRLAVSTPSWRWISSVSSSTLNLKMTPVVLDVRHVYAQALDELREWVACEVPVNARLVVGEIAIFVESVVANARMVHKGHCRGDVVVEKAAQLVALL